MLGPQRAFTSLVYAHVGRTQIVPRDCAVGAAPELGIIFPGDYVKPEDYNPVAREAFGRSLIDIGVSIFKGVVLLLTVVPLAAIFKSAFDRGEEVSFLAIVNNLSPGTQWLFIGLLGVAFVSGYVFRKEGLRHLHELEE